MFSKLKIRSAVSQASALMLGSVVGVGAVAQSDTGSDESVIEVVVVTAQKKEQNLLEVPVPVSVVDTESLARNNQFNLQNFFSTVPGLSLTAGFDGSPRVAVRGLLTATDYATPTTAIVIDDIAFGSSTGLGGGGIVPDLDPSALQRIELLRGPQGTLYGVSSLGGLLKYVTRDPSPDEFSARLEASSEMIENSDDIGYRVRGAANIPLSDNLAMYVSGFYRERAGFIDNLLDGEEGVGGTDTVGAYASLVWEPTDTLYVNAKILYQDLETDGQGLADPELGDLKQEFTSGLYNDSSVENYSLTIGKEFGDVDFTSITSYGVNESQFESEYTFFYGGFGFIVGEPTFTNAVVDGGFDTTKFSQEFRATFPIGENSEWLIGAYYTDEESDPYTDALAAHPTNGGRAPLGFSPFPSEYDEIAAFTNLTITFSDRLDLQLGLRYSDYNFDYYEELFGPLLGGATLITDVETSEDATTFLITPTYDLSDDVMVYLRIASGYRAGGPNSSCLFNGVPCTFEPDETVNYEIGAKGRFLDGRLALEASLYRIDWEDIQLQLVAQNVYTGNGGDAQSKGLEVSFDFQITESVSANGFYSYNDAVLKDDLDGAAVADSGDRLPYSSEHSGSLSLNYAGQWTDTIFGFAGITASYVDDREGQFVQPLRWSERDQLESYWNIDFSAGMELNEWTLNVFANNLTDERGEIKGGAGEVPPGYFQYIQPRTIGISVSKEFL